MLHALVEQPGVLACLSRRRGRRFKSDRGCFQRIGTVRKRKTTAQTFVIVCGFKARSFSVIGVCGFDSLPCYLKQQHASIWALASRCNVAVTHTRGGLAWVQLLPGALTTWPVRLTGSGCETLILATRVRFPYGLLNHMAKWWNWYTRDAQNVVPARACEFDSRLGYLNIADAAGAQLAFIRPVRARFDTGICNLRVGQCSSEPHKLRPPGATPGPATYGRVRKQAKRSR